MSDHPDMSASSWKYLQTTAGSRLSSFKGYVRAGPHAHAEENLNNNNERQSWRSWAGEKVRAGIRRRGAGGEGREVNTEVVNLFPGWAARRYPKEAYVGNADAPRPFEVDVFISGFAITHRAPEYASRSQRAFIRLAKGFASLPKLIADDPLSSSSSLHLSPSTEELLTHVHLPPTPTEITEDLELQALEQQLQRAKVSSSQQADESAPPSPTSSSEFSSSPSDALPILNSTPTRPTRAPAPLFEASTPADVLRRLHANLESRLQPFWASVLPGRSVRVRLYASPHLPPPAASLSPSSSSSSSSQSSLPQDIPSSLPLASITLLTAPDGSFQTRLRVPWDELCHHPQALHIAFGDLVEEHELLVVAELLPVPPSAPPSPQYAYKPYTPSHSHSPTPATPATATPHTSLRLPITSCPLRLISDVDDTVKASHILAGARAVFQAVFVKELRDAVVPGMGGWYRGMWERGVRFHYVSNGPFEYLPILNEFFQISQLPPGSIKLKSYAGRSLFHGLLSAPAARKRQGVLDVLLAFPESRFFLVGDSGEGDLELYADLARERADQILAVFIRDVSTDESEPLDDPTGWRVVGAGAAGTRSSSKPLVSYNDSTTSVDGSGGSTSSKSRRTWSGVLGGSGGKVTPLKINNSISSSGSRGGDYFTSTPLSAEPEGLDSYTLRTPRSGKSFSTPAPITDATPKPRPQYITHPPSPVPPPSVQRPPSSPRPSKTAMTDAEKKKHELQMRVYRARTQMPGHVLLRVFREPGECVEAEEILSKEEGVAREAEKGVGK